MYYRVSSAACIAITGMFMSALLLAAPPSERAPAAASASKTVPPKRICVRERPVGSNRPIRVCRDAAEVERTGERTREALGDAQTQRYNPPEADPR